MLDGKILDNGCLSSISKMEKVIYFQLMKISQLVSQNITKIFENIYVIIQPRLSELKKKFK